ncbi:MAG TPA: hypothetical protein VHV29_06925 [Terriglobales bacterium]|jgi:hypothetical protein|nr:hypothetical protein [Terriglobales bacterium]
MGRNKTPTAVLEAKGSFIRHPERERPDEPTTDRLLGPPPDWMTPEQKRVWEQLASEALPGVLFESDRMLFSLMVRLATKLLGNKDMMASEMSMLITLGSKFAMNPADRSRVTIDAPKDSSLQIFLQRQ